MKMLTDSPLCNMLPILPCLVLRGVLVAQAARRASGSPHTSAGRMFSASRLTAAYACAYNVGEVSALFDRKSIEQQLAQLPLYQYAWINTGELVFTERVRAICESECPMYGKTWACPPAVGTVESCRARCLAYPHALVVTTVTEVADIANIDETLATRAPHEAVTREAAAIVAAQAADIMVLSTEACAICEHCSYPDAPCRHPDKMYPCVESHGILATDLAEKHGIDFFGGNIVTWFSLIFYRD